MPTPDVPKDDEREHENIITTITKSHASFIPPPPLNQRYSTPLHEFQTSAPQPYSNKASSENSQADEQSERQQWRDPDPIPQPPAKYTCSLPPISEALRLCESSQSVRPDQISTPQPYRQTDPRRSYTASDPVRDVTRTQYLSHVQLPPPSSSASLHAPNSVSTSTISQQDNAWRRRSTEQSYYQQAPLTQPQQDQPLDDRRISHPIHLPPLPNTIITTLPFPRHNVSTTQPDQTAYGPTGSAPKQFSASTYPGPWQGTSLDDNLNQHDPLRPAYGDSVKRHLDGFDFDHSLNGIAESSHVLSDFSEFYRQKAHQAQRVGAVADSVPPLHHIDDMMKHGSRIQESLNRLRDVVVSQQAEQIELSREKASGVVTEESQNTQGDVNTGFAGSDPKKRRGRAAPPGKCHSCNRVDTPEWRRGPDGARTLCNACGLHYAKLTRKAGTSKVALVASDIRPKDDTPPSR